MILILLLIIVIWRNVLQNALKKWSLRQCAKSTTTCVCAESRKRQVNLLYFNIFVMENIFAKLGDADLDKVIASYAVDYVDMEFNIRKFRQRIYELAVDEKKRRERSVRHGKTFMEW